MACRVDLTSDAARCFETVLDPQVHEEYDINEFDLLKEFSANELKSVFFLLMTDIYDKESLKKYLQLVMKDKNYLWPQFCEKWHKEKFSYNVLIELLGTMRKFKCLKKLRMCKHAFKKRQSVCKAVPEICKFFFSICEELDDSEIRMLQYNMFPEISYDICGEELICLMLLHEKINCNDFSQLKQSLLALRREDLITKIETYEGQMQAVFFSDIYPIRQPTFQKPSGLAIILNETIFMEPEQNTGERLSLEERKGSEVDCRKLENLWQDFGFKVETLFDLTVNEIFRLLQDLKFRDLSPYDIFVLCIMSHGQKGCFYSSDSKKVDIDSFIGQIADSCMFGKPKLVFIQACQGEQHNEGIPVCPDTLAVQRELAVDSRPQSEIIPRHADVFKAMATIDNHVSYRDEQDGSLFISHLVKNIGEHGHKEDIQAILTKVKNGISQKNAPFGGKLYKQLPVSTSTLRKKVVLRRALHDIV